MKSGDKKLTILKGIGIHSSVWILLFLLNYFIVKNYPVAFKTWFHIEIWLIYIFVFYINYLLLMPFFLFKKKTLIYILLVLVLVFSLGMLREQVQRKYFFENIEKNIRRDDKGMLLPPNEIKGDRFIPRDGGPMDGPGMHKPMSRPFFPFGGNLFSLYSLLLIYATSTSIGLIKKWQDTEKKRIETEKEKLFAELSYLKKQVNPHFLFNALNNIYSLSLSKSDQTTNAILKLSSILRYMIYETNNKRHLKDEIEIINNYIDLQRFRITDKVEVRLNVKGDPDNYTIEPLLLLPIIENAFKFGVDNIHNSFIEILILVEANRLEFKATNKIVHRPPKNNEDFGIGIKNIQRRLELLYPEDHFFTFNEKDDIYAVNLNIRLKK